MTYFGLQCCLLSVIWQVNDCLPILTATNMNNYKPHSDMNIFTVKTVCYGYNSPYFHFYYVNNQSNVVMFKSALLLVFFFFFWFMYKICCLSKVWCFICSSFYFLCYQTCLSSMSKCPFFHLYIYTPLARTS